MGSRLARRVVQFANLPIKLLMLTSFTNIHEISLKTIPSATKIEVKRVLESLYGFEVERVQTLNMEGKKKKCGGILFAKPDYKKAYVTLKTPLSIDTNLFPLKVVEDARRRMNKKNVSSVVEVEEEEERKRHWRFVDVVAHLGNQNMVLKTIMQLKNPFSFPQLLRLHTKQGVPTNSTKPNCFT